MKHIYRQKSSRRSRGRRAAQPVCPNVNLSTLRAALFAAVGLSHVGCPGQQDVITRDSARISAGGNSGEVDDMEVGTRSGDEAGTTAQTMNTSAGAAVVETAGANAGMSANEMAGMSAGEAGGMSAGEVAGSSAGEVAGSSAGETAGMNAGEATGMSAGVAAGMSAGEPAGVNAGEPTSDVFTECGARPDVNAVGDPNGYAVCEDGRTFKVGPAACTVPPPSPEACMARDRSGCTADADCASGPNGRCVEEVLLGPSDERFCGCQYFCESDSDCADGQVCDCVGGTLGVCSMSSCAANEDCDSGLCEHSNFNDGCGAYRGVFCRSEMDMCSTDESCPSRQCSVSPYEPSEYWACYDIDCAIGRPAIVDGVKLYADLEERGGWGEMSDTVGELFGDLTLTQRDHLITHWSEVAALEHSSVASFARVTLELMGLGAPADLILDTQRAAADEVEHARDVYSLISTLRGCPVGPGDFPISSLTPRLDRREITLSVAREACLGETLGVTEVECAHALTLSLRGPHRVSEHLERVLRDETRHAALAWRTLAWLLEGASETLHNEVANVFYREARQLIFGCKVGMMSDLETHQYLNRFGVLTATQRRACYVRGLNEVVIPCAQKLLGEGRATPLDRLARLTRGA